MSRRLGRILTFGSAVVLAASAPAWAGGVTERVSVATNGVQGRYVSGLLGGPALSADGRFVAFPSGANNLAPNDDNGTIDDVFVRDRRTGTTERVGFGGDGGSFDPALSADGRFVAFRSAASNLIPGDTNGVDDMFVRDRRTGTTERASVGRNGAQANGSSSTPALSADGRFVAFTSDADNLVPGDTNGWPDVFLRRRW